MNSGWLLGAWRDGFEVGDELGAAIHGAKGGRVGSAFLVSWPIMMIPYKDFGRLRLADFVSSRKLAALEGWEFEERVWVGEALGFSEWLRLEGEPDVLRSMAIDFSEFPARAAKAVLKAIGLPVRAGMSVEELDKLLGERVVEHRFVADQLSCDYFTPRPHRYRVSCTVPNDGGLSYLVVMAPVSRRRR